jgi:uroporphyrinogen decarboxylase
MINASPKAAVLKTIAFEEIHPVPYWIDFTPGAYRQLRAHLQKDDLRDFLGNYAIDTFANSIHGVVPGDLSGDTWTDDFGVVWQGAVVDRGAPSTYPLSAAPSLKHYRFPDPDDPRRFSHLDGFLRDNAGLFTVASVDFGLLFERAWYLRGMANWLMDLHLNPGFVEDVLDHLTDYYVKSIAHLGGFKGLDAVCLIDDYGIQQGLVMAPEMWRRFFKPRLATIVKALEKQRLIPHLHSCGKVAELIPDFIDIGIRLLDPLQPEVMAVNEIKAKYGKRLVLLGGFSTQEIIPYGTAADVRRHVAELLQLGKGGGYIAFNSIPLQSDVPLENVLAILDVVQHQP